ncbi:MAG TPA: hypothetical protein VJ875_10525 [Pyrinomonadaceae bacterium]|nr:hypothetical protein [Pyrinomonadaceae bacterium]
MPEEPKPFAEFLPELVKAGKAAGFQPAVTLCVGGTLISGELIDGAEYFNQLIAETTAVPPEALTPQVATQLTTLFQNFASRYTRPPADPPPQGAVESEHIHLRNARIRLLDGRDLLAGPRGLWRVRLSAVDAATLGLLPAAQQR